MPWPRPDSRDDPLPIALAHTPWFLYPTSVVTNLMRPVDSSNAGTDHITKNDEINEILTCIVSLPPPRHPPWPTRDTC